jgi:hypothetical protein
MITIRVRTVTNYTPRQLIFLTNSRIIGVLRTWRIIAMSTHYFLPRIVAGKFFKQTSVALSILQKAYFYKQELTRTG